MSSFAFYNPTRLVFGEGEFTRLGALCKGIGKRALLVTGRSAARAHGYIDAAVSSLSDAGIECDTFEEAPPNPTDDAVDAGGRFARKQGCDFIIGLGGGSAMDSAKAIAVAARHPEPIHEYILPGAHGDKRIPSSALPIACVTTTSGTSSELNGVAVITITQTREKAALVGDLIYPRVAICDPELTYTMSPRVTASTGIDVLCHSLEGYISNASNPVGDVHAQEAISLVGKWLPAAFASGSDKTARRMMSMANMHAGYTLSNCGCTILHGLEHPVSGHYPQIAHGMGLAAMMKAYCRLGWQAMPEKFARLSELLGGPAEAQAAEVQIGKLLAEVGMDVTLSDLGVQADMLDTIAEDALRYMGRALTKTPCGAEKDLLMAVLRESL